MLQRRDALPQPPSKSIVMLGVMLGGFRRVMRGLCAVSIREMAGLMMFAIIMHARGVTMMLPCTIMVLGGGLMMMASLVLRHDPYCHGDRQSPPLT